MKPTSQLYLLLSFLMVLISCSHQNKSETSEKASAKIETYPSHNAQNSLDWTGTYSGTMPCASCAAIQTTISLSDEGTYKLKMVYLGEDEPNTVEASGAIDWNEAGNTITLQDEDEPNQYFVGENYLAKLDIDRNRITGDLAEKYLLRKE